MVCGIGSRARGGGVGYTPQRGLGDDFAFLTGHGLWGWIGQHLHHGTVFWASLRYRFAAWWLGTLHQTCDPATPCADRIPYSHHTHDVGLTLGGRPARWLRLVFSAHVNHRRYWDAGSYTPVSGPAVSKRRIDTAGRYALEATFRVRTWLTLSLSYAFTHNHSSIDEATTGFDESYRRHVVEVGLTLERW